MKKRKYQDHYCKICGRRKSNEKFSGSGYTAHICRDYAKLPKEKRDDMQTIVEDKVNLTTHRIISRFIEEAYTLRRIKDV